MSTEVRKGDGTAGDGRIMLRGETETLDGLAELALTNGKHGHHGHPTNERLKAHCLKKQKQSNHRRQGFIVLRMR